MYRSKFFYLMDVFSEKGRKIGTVKDILIDLNNYELKGFSVISKGFCCNNHSLLLKDIVYINDNMIVDINKFKKEGRAFLKFSKIKNMDIFDMKSKYIGYLDDIIIDEKKFNIKGIIVSTGIFNDFIQGKRIIPSEDIIFGEENILYFNNKCNNIDFKITLKNNKEKIKGND
ncbi:PRC-barrel domain-containing protein [Clostridium oceanicum]|uniref:PRC-barrel domain-containing protein n=1 Tax=Clostridium oceanicum TaxID=1543 RepID=A0ABN1JB47_9CLOT